MREVTLPFGCFKFVGFGKDQRQRQFAVAHPADEIPVGRLRIKPAVDKDKGTKQALPVAQVVFNQGSPGSPLGLAYTGVSVAGQIYQVPGTVY